MSISTLHAPEHQPLPPQRDPWGEAAQTPPVDEGATVNQADLRQRFDEIVNGYGDRPTADQVDNEPVTPTAEFERRNHQNMLANFALAQTLGSSHPELMQELEQATRPNDYQGRHARPRGYQGRHRR